MNLYFTSKRKPLDMPDYRAYVVSVGCIAEGPDCSGPIDPNHFTLSSQGGSDSECGGLCRYTHHVDGPQSFHKLGFVKFCAVHHIKWPECRARLLEGFYETLGMAHEPLPTAEKKKRARGSSLQPLTKTCNSF